jgi:hypothetical protein
MVLMVPPVTVVVIVARVTLDPLVVKNMARGYGRPMTVHDPTGPQPSPQPQQPVPGGPPEPPTPILPDPDPA